MRRFTLYTDDEASPAWGRGHLARCEMFHLARCEMFHLARCEMFH